MPTFEHIFDKLPFDRWWVRWIDHASMIGSDDPVVHLTLSRVPDEEGHNACKYLTDTIVVTMNTSYLPAFSLGDIFEDRRLLRSTADPVSVASVCDSFDDGATTTFEFDASIFGFTPSGRLSDAASGLRLADKVLIRSEGKSKFQQRRVLKASEYPGLATPSSRVLVIEGSDSRTFLIPAAELLRALVAPHPQLASRLFQRSLAVALRGIIEATRTNEDGTFEMTFGPGFDGRHALAVANLIKDYNPIGNAAAGRLHPSLSEPDRYLTPGYEHYRNGTGVADRSSVLPIVMPFGSGIVGICAKCFEVDRDRFLVAKITRVDLPALPRLKALIPRDTTDPDLAKARGAVRLVRPTAAAGIDQRLDLLGVPSRTLESQRVEVEQVFWVNGPPIDVVVDRRRRHGRERSGATGPVPSLSGAALGDPVTGGTHAHADADHSGQPAPDRFDQTIAMFDRLRAGDRILGHGPYHPPVASGRAAKRGGLDVWVWPKGKSWTRLRPGSSAERPRTILVRKVVLQGGVAYWMSIEGSGTVTRPALVIAAGMKGPGWAIDEIARRQGDVREVAEVIQRQGGRAAVFIHRIVQDRALQPAGFADASKGRSLDDDSAFETLKRLFAPAG